MNIRKQPNRFLAILLSVCMLLTMLPMGGITAYAADEVISSDTTWDAQTISGTVQINSGVTVTIEGDTIIEGNVTIYGGGTIARGSGNAYFSIGSGDSLTLDGVTVDGKSTSSSNSMFNVENGTLNIKDSTVQNCVKSDTRGGAIRVYGGNLTIENTTIKDCSAEGYGGAIYLRDNATATIKSGTFSGNKTTDSSYGGGFVYNRSKLTIEGGSFLNNSSAGRGGAIYNAGTNGTATYIRGGVFEGNTSSYSTASKDYTGSGAVYYSSENTADTILYISGSVQFGNGTASDGTDGVYLDASSSGTAMRKTQISSALQYPIHIYVACEEDRVIAQGVDDYALTASDMTKIQFHDVGSTGTQWYPWLNSGTNEVYLSATEPIYVVYDANGATGSVTDNNIYTSGNAVSVKSEEGLIYEGHTFTGWNTKADGTGTTYQPGETLNISVTTTLYAQWEYGYNVWVGGVRVTASNASDVLGDGAVSYNADTNTLTLNGADIKTKYSVPGGGYAAIVSYDDLNISLCEGSENKITLTDSTILTGVIAISKSGAADDTKNITVSGNGKLNININSSASAAIGIAGSAVTLDGGADVSVTVNGTSTNTPFYLGIMGYSSVDIKNSTVTASVSGETGENIAILGADAVTIESANVTASGFAGIMSVAGLSITGMSTVKATGTTYAIVANEISMPETLIAQGRADAESGGLSDVTTRANGIYNTFVLPSDTETVAHYVEIVPASSLHRHNICGETSCDHDGHAAVTYTALDSNVSGTTLTGGNYYLTENITNVNPSIQITGTVNLCLNGHTISGSAQDGIFRIGAGGVLNVCDCQEGGKITETGTDEHNPVFIHSGGALNLYSGTIESRITAVVIDQDPSDNTDFTGGTVNVYGGTVHSTGSASQAIKVNKDMTDTAVNISGGSVTSSSRGISAESGRITISGGEITGNVDTYSDMTMSGGTINGRLTILRHASDTGRISVKISGTAKIESTSSYAICINQTSPNVDLEITGGTITANNGYGVQIEIGNSTSRLYLSGSPEISGSTADIGSSTSTASANVSLVLHAKGDANSAYEGGSLTITPSYLSDGYYVAQGVTSADMVDKLSIVHANADDYYLAYNETNSAIQMKEYTYTVTLPESEAFTVKAESGSSSPVDKYEDYSFTVTLLDGYYKTDSFAVYANSTELTPDDDGVYTISNITEAQTVTVTGVALDNTLPTAEIQLGKNKWNTFLNSITFGLFFKETQTVTISPTDNESGVEKTEYFVSDIAYETTDALEKAADGKWGTYSKSFSITPKSKNIIYAKVTDNVGNVGYASSNGIVLYTDAMQKTQSISFTKTATVDVTAEVTLNGNTIDKIYCGTALLDAGTDYTVDGGTITFKASWLDTLTANDYTLTIHYNPLGVEYVDGNENDNPNTTSIALSVNKATGSVEITNDITKVFDGSAVSDVRYQTPSTGIVKVEYKVRDADDSTYTTTKPSAVDEYIVRVTVAADDDYTEASATADFDITYLSAPSDPFDLSGTQGTSGWYTSDVTITPHEGFTISSTLNGDYSDSLTISESTENVMIYLKNESGQMTDAVSVGDIKIDKDNPTISADGDTISYLQEDTVEITVSDLTSGVKKVEVQKGNGEFADITNSYESGYLVKENEKYTFRVTDNAGRTAEKILVYNHIDRQKPVVTIEALHGGESYTPGAWTNKDIKLTPKNETQNLGTTTYKYKVDGGEWQTYTANIVISADTDADGTVYEFMAISESGVESDAVSITVKRDTVVPEGDITIKENSIRQLLNTITFGLFFNKDVDVAITGTDALSGVESIQYYRSAEILTEDGLISLTGWTDYDSTIRETSKDAEKFIYYVKVTDNAGNTTFFGSDGVVFDLTAPSITGVTNGSTYYTTQKVTVTDANLDSVTLGSEPVAIENGALTLSGNMDATYTITAKDKAGNCTTVTVTMNTIASLAEDIGGLIAANVTSADEKTITAVKTAASNVDTENATDDEKAALKGIIDNCDALLEKINDVEKEISDVTGSVDGFDADSVKSTNKEAIEEFVKRIETLLSGENLTEQEKQNLETVKGDAEGLLDKIDETTGELSDVTGGVGGFDTDSVKSTDKEAIEEFVKRIETLLSGENLTEVEKENLESVKNEAEALLDKIGETSGAGNTQNIQNVQDVTPNNVKPEDKENLETAKEDIEQALNDYADNYTEDEKEQLEKTLIQIQGALEVIQKVEKSEEAISALPESVSPDDTEAEELIDAAKEQYDALSEYEKTLVSDEAAEKLETLLAQLGDYRIIEGDGSTWTKGSSDGLTLTANGAYSKFTGIEIDGAALSAENYTVKSGSTVITLKPDYLNTLTVDEHAISVLYNDGEAAGTFIIAEKPTEPADTSKPTEKPTDENSTSVQTGDDFHIAPWIMMILISGGAVLTLSVRRRKQKRHE